MNSINYPNYIINVDNVNAIGNTLYLGNNKNVTIGDTNHILNLKSMLHINGNSGEYGNVLTHNGTTIDWEPISINSKGISGSIQYNDGHSGLTGNTLFTYTYQPTVGSTGTIYIRSGNVGVTGVNTQFITELRINHNLITSFPGGTTSWGKIKEIVNDTNLQFYLADFLSFKTAKKAIEKNFEMLDLSINNKILMKSCIIQYIEEDILKKENYNLNLFSSSERFFDLLRSKKKSTNDMK